MKKLIVVLFLVIPLYADTMPEYIFLNDGDFDIEITLDISSHENLNIYNSIKFIEVEKEWYKRKPVVVELEDRWVIELTTETYKEK